MPELKIRLVGQLIDEPPVILDVSKNILKINRTAKEYLDQFPEIFLTAEWGYFKYPIAKTKAKALTNLIGQLNMPINKLQLQLQNLKN